MKKALFAVFASVAFLGASCSVQEFSPVVMDKSTIMASLADAPRAAIGEQDITRYYGKYSFRYGNLSANLFNLKDFSIGYGLNANGQPVRQSGGFADYYLLEFAAVQPSTTYTLSNVHDTTIFFYDANKDFISYYNGSSFTFTTPSNCRYVRKDLPPSYTTPMLNEGSTALPYQPYAYGFSFDTPVTGVGSCVLDMYYNNGTFMPRSSYLAYNYNDECKVYTDGIHFDFGGNDDLLAEFRAKFLGAYASGRSSGFDWDEDYDDTELVFVPVIDDYSALTYCEFYIEDRYQAGYQDGYYASSAYEIIKDISRFEFVYHTGTGDDEESHTIVKEDSVARDYLAQYVINGLLSFRSVVADLTDGVSDVHDIAAHLKYSQAKTIEAAPLYIDYEAFTALVNQQFRTTLQVYSQRVQVPWYVFNSSLEVSFQGNLANYSTGLLSDRYSAYTDIHISYPMPDVGGRLNYIGILSGYAQGYADAMTESGETIDDLTQRILDLQEDLEQYQGKTYEQIYNLGVQAGLDENAQGAATFNSLFGNILTAPLTILNGLTDISFFGMPILTAILSLLMVAMALFLFKRFK